jgi:hypothetical protein
LVVDILDLLLLGAVAVVVQDMGQVEMVVVQFILLVVVEQVEEIGVAHQLLEELVALQ